MRFAILAAAIALQVACVSPLRRAKAAPPPPGPMQARIPDLITTSDAPPAPKTLPPPPAVPVSEPDPATAKVVTAETELPPPPPRPRPRRRPPAAAVPVEKPANTEVETPGPPPFRLGEVMPPGRREELLRQADSALSYSTKVLAATENRRLRNPQINASARIRRFIEESRSAMASDPIRARNLALRAKAFAEALEAELR